MSVVDLVLIASAAFIGWWLVSWLFDSRKPKAPQQEPGKQPQPHLSASSSGLSLMELGERWHTILGVRPEASDREIEAGYRAALEACDRDLVANAAASSRRQQVEAAYEFIRSARKHT